MPRKLEEIASDVASGKLTKEEGAAEVQAGIDEARRVLVRKNSAALASGVVAFIGLIFVLIGSVFGIYSLRKAENAERCEGQVVRLIASGGKGGLKPVVRYAVNGQQFEITGSVATSPPAFEAGEKVNLLYDPHNPADAHIDSFVERWLFAVIFGGIGGLLLVIATIIWLVTRSGRRKVIPSSEA